MSVAPTVIAEGSLEGELLHASAVLLPAATAKVIPALTAFATAVFREGDNPPPRLMLAAAGVPLVWWSEAAQLIPAITPEVVPDPLQSSTRTATRFAFFAIPYWVPATVPETCVPWPLQSVAGPLSVTSSSPLTARPPKSALVR